MELGLNKEQEQLLELQEKFFFTELSANEQGFVLSQTSKEAFDQAHLSILEAKNLYVVPEVRPFVLTEVKSNRLRQFIIPFASASAAALLTFFFFRKETVIVKVVEKPIFSIADTVYLQEKMVDTVFKYREGKTIVVQEKSNLIPHIDLTVHVKSNEVIPPLSVLDLKNRGESMKEDKLVSLMDGVVY
jgi:hypothetical protein